MSGAPSSRRLLAIAYAFPPASVVGVYRTLKYCKYLPAHGWVPIVLTTPVAPGARRDDRLCREVPRGVMVVRAWDPAPWRLIAAYSARRRHACHEQTPVTVEQATPPSHKNKADGVLKRLILGLLFHCPDSELFWVPFAIAAGARLLLSKRVDAIYSTSPPHSAHLAAIVLSKVFRKPCVVDFRDPWEPSLLFPRLMRWLKKLVVCHAESIICVSDGERRELLEEFPELPGERVVVITNGYDPADFDNVPVQPKDSEKTLLSHVGIIHRGTGGELFEALRIIARDHPDAGRSMTVRLVGGYDEEYEDAVRSLERAGVVTCVGQVSHAVAIGHMMASDALLLVLGGDRFPPSELPSKVFEYLHARRPIIAVSSPGEIWQLLTKSGGGIAVPARDPRALATALLGLCDDLRAGRWLPRRDTDYIARFDRKVLTERFVAVLNQVTGGVPADCEAGGGCDGHHEANRQALGVSDMGNEERYESASLPSRVAADTVRKS